MKCLLGRTIRSLRAPTQGLRPKGGHHRLRSIPFLRSRTSRCRVLVFGATSFVRGSFGHPIRERSRWKPSLLWVPCFLGRVGFPSAADLQRPSAVETSLPWTTSGSRMSPPWCLPKGSNPIGSPPTPRVPSVKRVGTWSQLPTTARPSEIPSGLEIVFLAPVRAPSTLDLPNVIHIR